MQLQNFVSELVHEWQKLYKEDSSLKGIAENKEIGMKGEKSALNRLKKDFSDYEFVLTDNSWSPADIIGFKKHPNYLHFVLYQVKTSINDNKLTSKILEEKTLPVFVKDVLKKVFLKNSETKKYRKKEVFITTGYLGVHCNNGKNKINLKIPYKTFTMNNLSLNASQKTEIKNRFHK